MTFKEPNIAIYMLFNRFFFKFSKINIASKVGGDDFVFKEKERKN